MSIYSQNRLDNVSAIGEKFVFSKYLEPVEESVDDTDDFDQIAESLESMVETDTAEVNDKKEASDDNKTEEACKGSEACKESTELDIKRLKECVILLDETKNIDYGKEIINILSEAMEEESVAEETSLEEDLVREAIEEWYNENNIEINDYEQGRIDMFVESVLNEKAQGLTDDEKRKKEHEYRYHMGSFHRPKDWKKEIKDDLKREKKMNKKDFKSGVIDKQTYKDNKAKIRDSKKVLNQASKDEMEDRKERVRKLMEKERQEKEQKEE